MQTDNRNRSQDVFERHADAYDAWYDSRRGQSLFRAEVACLRAVLNPAPPLPGITGGAGFVALRFTKSRALADTDADVAERRTIIS